MAYQYTLTPAGVFTVAAGDLSGSCLPTQSNTGVGVTVPEGGQADVTVLFTPTECLARVQRRRESSAYGGTVDSDSAPEPRTRCLHSAQIRG